LVELQTLGPHPDLLNWEPWADLELVI
jgi:hypothetical protein